MLQRENVEEAWLKFSNDIYSLYWLGCFLLKYDYRDLISYSNLFSIYSCNGLEWNDFAIVIGNVTSSAYLFRSELNGIVFIQISFWNLSLIHNLKI